MSAASVDRIAIILVNYKGTSDTIECIESISSMKKPAGGVVVYLVDNASPDDSLSRLREWISTRKRQRSAEVAKSEIHGIDREVQVFLISSPENRGFAAGCNLGLARAYDDGSITHFWLLNNDTIVDSDAAMELLASSQLRQDRNMCGSTLVYYDDPQIVQAAGGARYLPWIGRSRHALKREYLSNINRKPAPKFDYIVGASMFFSRSVLECIGYLPERYFLYVEEADWCARAREAGIPLDWASGSIVLHKEGRSTGADERFQRLGDGAFYYVVRNNLLYLWERSRFFVLPAAVYALLQSVGYSVRGDAGKVKVALRAIREFWQFRNKVEARHFPSCRNDYTKVRQVT